MTWLLTNRRSAVIIGITLLLPIALYMYALITIWTVGRDYQSGIDNLSPRIARLRGLIEREEALRQAVGEVDRRFLNLVYSAEQDRATVSANLQKEVRQMLVDAGLSVANSQVLPILERGLFDYIGLRVTVTGDMAGLDSALESLASYMPLVLVESLAVSPKVTRRVKGQAAEQQAITATLQLLSLRALQ